MGVYLLVLLTINYYKNYTCILLYSIVPFFSFIVYSVYYTCIYTWLLIECYYYVNRKGKTVQVKNQQSLPAHLVKNAYINVGTH